MFQFHHREKCKITRILFTASQKNADNSIPKDRDEVAILPIILLDYHAHGDSSLSNSADNPVFGLPLRVLERKLPIFIPKTDPTGIFSAQSGKAKQEEDYPHQQESFHTSSYSGVASIV